MFIRTYIFNWWIFHCNVSLSKGEATRLVSKQPLNTPDNNVLNHGFVTQAQLSLPGGLWEWDG